jgi:hypothetical protein
MVGCGLVHRGEQDGFILRELKIENRRMAIEYYVSPSAVGYPVSKRAISTLSCDEANPPRRLADVLE